MDDVRIVPANQASWEDLVAIFGRADYPAHCQCQRFKLGQAGHSPHPRGAREEALRADTQCGDPAADATSGLVAYVGGEPAGWVAVEPRVNYPKLGKGGATAWKGREEDRTDPTVWSITCFAVAKKFRGERLTYPLCAAAVDYARERGARAVEGYPIVTEPGVEITWGEVFVGPLGAFEAAGFTEVNQPSKRRRVMRMEFDR